MSPRCLHIGREPEEPNAQGQEAQKVPPEKAPAEAEQFPLVPTHDLLACGHGKNRPNGGIIGDDKVGHRAGESHDDSGDNQQQAPQGDEERHPKGEEVPVDHNGKAIPSGVLFGSAF